jgi:hypothetical protein
MILPSQQILAMNADNASSNDTQWEALTAMPNSFELENHVHCFNHTLQLSAKTLLCPFNVVLGKATDDGANNGVDDLLDLDDDEDDNKDDNRDEDKDKILPYVPDIDDIDDGINKLDELNGETHEGMIADTAAVHEMVSKLRHLSFAIVQSTTIALPAWCRYCKKLKLKSRWSSPTHY